MECQKEMALVMPLFYIFLNSGHRYELHTVGRKNIFSGDGAEDNQ